MVKQTVKLNNGSQSTKNLMHRISIKNQHLSSFIETCQVFGGWILSISYLINLRGLGQSLYNNVCSVFADWANDLVDLCSIKNIKKCIAFGWSFGGGVAMKFAEIAPEMVTNIVLTCSVPHNGVVVVNQQKPCKTRQELAQNTQVMFMNDNILTKNIAVLNYAYLSYFFTHLKDYPKEKREQLVKTSLQQRCYLDVMYALANSDISIKNIKAKVLIFKQRFQRSMGKRIKSSHLKVQDKLVKISKILQYGKSRTYDSNLKY